MDTRLLALEKEFVARFMEFHPSYAVAAGLHEHDHRLEELGGQSIEGFCAVLDRVRSKVTALEELGAEDQVEREVLLTIIDATLFDYRTLRSWQRDPYSYAEILAGQLNTILIFDYAPIDERLKAIIAKERRIVRFLETAKSNLLPTAPILVKYGVRGFEGALSLVRRDVPRVFGRLASEALRKELDEATEEASTALESFLEWLWKGYSPAGAGDYALGAEVYAGWLAARERITAPLDELETWAQDAIDATREEMLRETSRLEAKADPAAVVERITKDHPPTGKVVAETRRIAEEVHQWLERSGIVSLPTDDRVLIADTPEFMRWSFGSMWTPGPYEKTKVRATFYATDADPSWPAEKQDEHLTAFCRRGLENLAIHEAYPGHFIQGLHQNRVLSPVRMTYWWGVFGEGWAHYCEQLAVEEGFGDGAPEVRIIQLQEALNRLCRFVNGIRLHTRSDWNFDKGTAFFEEKAWLAPAVARAECERGAFDPFYLRYTLGKKEILELRAECKRRLGVRFDLRAFHDALLGSGSGPMPAMRDLTLLRLGIA